MFIGLTYELIQKRVIYYSENWPFLIYHPEGDTDERESMNEVRCSIYDCDKFIKLK